jgi:hypothetical protein
MNLSRWVAAGTVHTFQGIKPTLSSSTRADRLADMEWKWPLD